MGLLLDQLFDEDLDEHTARVLADELGARRDGYITLNRFNVKIQPDVGIVVIEDELDPESEEVVRLTQFIEALDRWRRGNRSG